MENKKYTFTTKQLAAIVSVLVAIAGGELAVGTTLFESDSNRIFVGFFINETSGRLEFQHIDQKIYQPFYDKQHQRYYIVLDDGSTLWCY